MLYRILFVFISLLISLLCRCQNNEDKKNLFVIDAELKPRMELRKGYRTPIPAADTSAAFFINQRTRLNFSLFTKIVNLRISLQDARVWGAINSNDPKGSFALFEGYAEIPFTDEFQVKVGRQRIMYDNQRLFAENNWRVDARSHDALQFRYKNKKNGAWVEATGAWNQKAELNYGTDYTSVYNNTTDYKFLSVLWYQQKFGKLFTLSVLNCADGFQGEKDDKKLKLRYTSGGRLELEKKNLYITLAAYGQFGQTTMEQKILAYYIQPEIKYNIPLKKSGSITIRAGAEILSGQKPGNSTFNSFIPLYGVAHRFNGSMDYFTRFPGDTKNLGLINPYFFIIGKISNKVSLRSDLHSFHSEYKGPGQQGSYLGFENDWLLSYMPHPIIKFDAGVSYMILTKNMNYIRGGVDYKFPGWAYLELTIKPELFRFKW